MLTCAEVANSFQADFSEPNESRLIRVNNCTYEKINSYKGTLRDSTGECILYLDTSANLPQPSGNFDVVGILKQYDYNAPYDSEYEVSPRFPSDFISRSGSIFISQPIETEITSSSVTISWDTDNPATSLVRYGLTEGYELGAYGDSALVTHHVVEIGNLAPATIYRCRAISTNETGTSRSDELIFSSASSPASRGMIVPYFNQKVEHEYSTGKDAAGRTNFSWLVRGRIDSARYSIDVCVYNFKLEEVATRLIDAKNRGVRVRVIYDDYYENEAILLLRDASIAVLNDKAGPNDGNDLMHNKFIVFDYRDNSSAADDWVWTGSYNLTISGTLYNAENIILIQDEALAACYTEEFNEMWGSDGDVPNPANSKFGTRKEDNTPHRFNIGGVWVEQYMSPSDDTESHIIEAIQSADYSAYFCIYSFTQKCTAIAGAMKNKWYNVNGFLLKGVFDSENAILNSQYPNFNGSGSQPWSPRPDVHLSNDAGILHHKYVLIDPTTPESDPMVVTGSHNWSWPANNTNDENTLIIHDASITNQYLQEFAARYHKAGGSEDLITAVSANQIEGGSCFGKDFVLHQNFPNPFNNSTLIRLNLQTRKSGQSIYLKIFDVLGRTVKSWKYLLNCESEVKVLWDGTDDTGKTVASGVYLCTAIFGDAYVNIKMVFLQ